MFAHIVVLAVSDVSWYVFVCVCLHFNESVCLSVLVLMRLGLVS